MERRQSLIGFGWPITTKVKKGRHPLTNQHLVETHLLTEDIQAQNVEISENETLLRVIWKEGCPAGLYPASFLLSVRSKEKRGERTLWDASFFKKQSLSEIQYEKMMSDKGALDCFIQIERFGFCFVNGTPATSDAINELCQSVSSLRSTLVGDFWNFTSDMSHADTAYSHDAVDLHTDGWNIRF